MFRYPTLQKGASFIMGKGHTTAASKARFSADDARRSQRVHDRSILQYRVVALGGPGEDSASNAGAIADSGSKKGKKKKKGKKRSK